MSAGATGYTYDNNGNVNADGYRGITGTTFLNPLNLPVKVTYSATKNIEYTYDAAGVRWKKKTVEGATVAEKYYLENIEYNGTNLEAIYHSDGRAIPVSSTYEYQYTIKDHLGNSRVMFKMVSGTATLIQENHYYPFGMEFEGTFTGSTNKYRYNGKELHDDFALNLYDYGARFYDPSVGRFTAVDALADHPNQVDKSPLAYTWNNPTNLTDPDGNCPRCAKALIKTVIKSVAQGKVDLGEVYDLLDAGKTLVDPNSSILDKGLAIFDILSPVSSKELKAGADLVGIADGANDASKVAKKVNKNANNAEGNFVLYEVKDKDGTPLKVGKADADRTNSFGDPVRMKDSERQANKIHPGATATIIPGSQRNTTTGQMKDYEAKTVRDQRANGNSLNLNKERDKRYHNK